MANVIHIPRNHPSMGLLLPWAVCYGYFSAQRLELGRMAVAVGAGLGAAAGFVAFQDSFGGGVS